MGINKAFTQSFFVIGGSVRTTGGSNELAQGQLALVDIMSSGVKGATILASAVGLPKDQKSLELRLGIGPNSPDRSHSNKPASTAPFKLREIKKLRVSAPERTEQSIDDVVIGYDGFDPATAFTFKTGQKHFNLILEVKNGAIQYRGGTGDTEVININVEIPSCDVYDNCADCDECAAVDCKEITLEAIERLKRKQLAGGTLLEEYVDITPVFSCDTPASATLIPYTYYTLDVCDTGDAEALAYVAGQYNVPVIRINRVGSTSTYQMLLADTAGAPNAYEQTIASIVKGCEDCPEGWTEEGSGYLYAITIQDDGVNLSSTITTNLANAKYVANSISKGGNDGGVGMYTALYTSPITSAEIASFVGGAAPRNTATVGLVGEVAALCSDDTVTEIDWVAGESCNAIAETYTIVLPDNGCGNSILSELQAAFADLTIAISDHPDKSTLELTLTGTDGTANINIGGVNYLATFDTDLTTTAEDFVTTHAAAILTATGVVVTEAAGVITFEGLNTVLEDITITNVTEDLAGTLGGLDPIEYREGCQTQYETTVISNLVCEECDPVFLDYYKTSAPGSYNSTAWTKAANAASSPSGNCLCGIRFRGKTFVLSGDEALRDLVGFTETSTQIRVAGGFPTEIREGIGFIDRGTYPVKYFSRWIPRTHLYGNLREIEKLGRGYFLGETYKHGYLSRLLRNEVAAVQDNMAQAVVYYLTVEHEDYSQSFAGKHAHNTEYAIFVEYGKHAAVEDLLNNLAANAGVPPVTA